jgi:hypothetical protein
MFNYSIIIIIITTIIIIVVVVVVIIIIIVIVIINIIHLPDETKHDPYCLKTKMDSTKSVQNRNVVFPYPVSWGFSLCSDRQTCISAASLPVSSWLVHVSSMFVFLVNSLA